MSSKRFGLRTLLLCVAGVACVLGLVAYSHRRGEHAGYERGFNAAIEQRLSEATLLSLRYAIDDVIAKGYPDDDVDTAKADLRKSIIEKIKPETWDLVGGYGTIEVVTNEYDETSIVVDNTTPVHIEISQFLDDLRGAAIGIRDRSLVKKLYEAQVTRNETE